MSITVYKNNYDECYGGRAGISFRHAMHIVVLPLPCVRDLMCVNRMNERKRK